MIVRVKVAVNFSIGGGNMFGLFKRKPLVFAPSTAKELVHGVVSKISSGDARKIAVLYTQGRICIVDEVDEVPSHCVAEGSAFYDAEITYIVASRINRNDFMRDLTAACKRHHARRPQDLPQGIRWS